MNKIKEMAAEMHDAIHIGQHYMQKNKKSYACLEVKLAGEGHIQGQITMKSYFLLHFRPKSKRRRLIMENTNCCTE